MYWSNLLVVEEKTLLKFRWTWLGTAEEEVDFFKTCSNLIDSKFRAVWTQSSWPTNISLTRFRYDFRILGLKQQSSKPESFTDWRNQFSVLEQQGLHNARVCKTDQTKFTRSDIMDGLTTTIESQCFVSNLPFLFFTVTLSPSLFHSKHQIRASVWIHDQMARVLSVFLLCTVVVVSGFYLPGVAPQEYSPSDEITIKVFWDLRRTEIPQVEKMESSHTQLPYEYFTLPFCEPEEKVDSGVSSFLSCVWQ